MHRHLLVLSLALLTGCSSCGSTGGGSAGGGSTGSAPTPPPGPPPGPPIELAATIGTRPPEYGGSSYAAENMLDDDPRSYWSSNLGPTFPLSFTLTLPTEAELTGLQFENLANGYATSGPKDVTIEVATASAPTTFAQAATATLPMEGNNPVNLATPMRASTVRVTMRTNHGGSSAVISTLRLLGRGGTPRTTANAAAGAGGSGGAAAAAGPEGAHMAALRGLTEATQYMPLLASVGLDTALRTSMGMTILVPNDAAIAAMPADLRTDRARLRNALAGMMLMGTLSRENAAANPSWGGLDQGRTQYAVSVAGGVFRVGEATVVRADVPAGGCSVHVIDRFLVPATFDASQGRNPFGVNLWALPQ